MNFFARNCLYIKWMTLSGEVGNVTVTDELDAKETIGGG